jgi:hypothetical protein
VALFKKLPCPGMFVPFQVRVLPFFDYYRVKCPMGEQNEKNGIAVNIC